MFRFFLMLLALPWPVMALLSAGLFWVAKDTYQRATAEEAAKAQALQDGAPEPVALDQFGDGDVHLADEVNVTAWINTDHNYELTKERKGTDTVRRMYVLFGPGDGPESKVARGVVVLQPERMKDFIDLLAANVADPADPRFLFHLNGAREKTPDLSYMVDEALDERGLTKDADFLVVEPYLVGRAAALAPDEGAAERRSIVFLALGVMAGLLALGKFWARRRGRAGKPGVTGAVSGGVSGAVSGAAFEATAPMTSETTGQAYGAIAAPVTGVWSPIEAVKAKQMAIAGPGPGVDTSAAAKPVRSRIGIGAAFRTVRNMSLAAVVLGWMYVAFGQTGGLFPPFAMMTGMTVSEMGADPFAVGSEKADLERVGPETVAVPQAQARVVEPGDGADGAGLTDPMPEGISGAVAPLPQIGDKPPTPADQVQEDIAAGMSPADAIRGAITAEFPDETGPSGPVFLTTAKDEPAAEAGVMQRLRDLVPQGWGGGDPDQVAASVAGGGLWRGPAGIAVLLALGSVLATIAMVRSRRSRLRAAAMRGDPWARISERLQ